MPIPPDSKYATIVRTSLQYKLEMAESDLAVETEFSARMLNEGDYEAWERSQLRLIELDSQIADLQSRLISLQHHVHVGGASTEGSGSSN